MIDVNPHHLETVARILAEQVPECEVRAFGSRVTWTAKDYSDLDLAIVGERALEVETLSRLKEAFEESDLPFRVDVLDWHAISPAFQKVIEKQYEVVQKGKKKGLGMGNEWASATVGDVFDLVTGYAFKSADFVEKGIPVIKIKNVKAGKFSEHEFSFVSSAFLSERSGKLACFGDLLISMSGNRHDGSLHTWVGKIAQFRKFGNYFINQRIGALRVKQSVPFDSRFASYLLSSLPYQELFIAIATSSGGQANLSPDQILGATMRYPDLDSQRAIGHILGTLDDKIELNRRMNETLEAMAQALFKSWFVDFDPVRAKCRGEPACSPQSGHTPQSGQAHRPAPTKWPQHILDLFPDRFVDSELGEIPEGWEIKGLDKIACFLNGLALQKYPPTAGRSLPVIKIAQLRAGNTNGADRASADLDPDYIVEDGDILFSWSGSLECVFWAGRRGALNQHLFKVTSATYPRWLSYLGIHTHLDNFRHIAASKATTMGHIQRYHLSDAKLVVPPKPLLDVVDAKLSPILESVWQRNVQSRILAALRDTLLPKLLSGEIALPAAEALAEDVS